MEVQNRQGPAFGVARITMGPHERIKAEAGAMMATIPTVTVEAKAEGGVLKSLKRAALGGESFFITSYIAPAEGGWVDVAARLPGDTQVLDLEPGQAWFVQKGSWLASADGVEMDTARPVGDPGSGDDAPSPQFNMGALVDVFVGLLRGVALFLSNALVVLFLMVFILVEAPGLPRKLQRAFSLTDAEVGRLFKVKEEIQTYLGIKTAVSLATGFLIGGWLVLLGVDYAVLWGLVAFLLNYVPSLGSIVAAVPTTVLTWVDMGWSQAVLVAVGYLVVNLVLGNIIEPHLVGRQFGLSTMVVVFALVFWYWLWGPVGALLSVPLTMIIKILLQNTEDLRWVAYLLGPNPRKIP